jgi:hypothetical protein
MEGDAGLRDFGTFTTGGYPDSSLSGFYPDYLSGIKICSLTNHTK